MNRRDSVSYILLAFLALGFIICGAQLVSPGSQTMALSASSAAPSPTPTPGSSPEAQRAQAYIAQRDGISAERLIILNDYADQYPLLGRAFRMVTILDTKHDRFYDVLVDLDGYIEEDLAAIRDAEEKAYLARYGKLERALYERLQRVSGDEALPVAIWVAGKPGRSEEDYFTLLAAKFPQTRAALERSGKAIDVDDPDLAARIKAEYNQMRVADTTLRVQPLVAHLTGRGIAVFTNGALPSVTAWLTKQQILELAQRDDVGMLYLIEERGHKEMNTALHTDLVPVVWARGFNGTGVEVAILEDGRIDPGAPMNIADVRDPSQNLDWHKTMVASVTAGRHGIYPGTAPGAALLDAGFDIADWPGPISQQNAVNALRWAIESPHTAPIVNISIGWEENNDLRWTDRAFDYWARSEFVLIVKSAGNTGGCLTSPGKGWNVFAVGGTDDNDTAGWGDDSWWDGSAYINPVGQHREKPEVVAPAANITTISLNGVPRTESGTSLAAPQVAGLAALLIDRDSSLASWPEAIRAIIMASATHNIDGPTGIPTGMDLKDGAGAINAAYADEVAKQRHTSFITPADVSGWWGTSTSDIPVGGDKYCYFNATAGQHIRVAISWWSKADSPANNYSFDRLDTDLNLGVQRFNGSSWEDVPGAWSVSHDNNYELVECTAPATGQYRIVVRKAHAYNGETENFVGIALLKLHRLYLPLVLKGYTGTRGMGPLPAPTLAPVGYPPPRGPIPTMPRGGYPPPSGN